MLQAQLIQSQAPVAGIDEAGRGPLAGPVVAAAVILDPNRPIKGLADSKQVAAPRRQVLADEIKAGALSWSVAWADAAEIDVLNILAATMLAMRRAVLGLSIVPTAVQVDGNRIPNLLCCGRRINALATEHSNSIVRGEAIVGGDAKIPAISAASIIAKTTRDRMMVEMDKIYPDYGFARHKGYGTEIHRERLQQFGPCEQHRQSFAPVRLAR